MRRTVQSAYWNDSLNRATRTTGLRAALLASVLLFIPTSMTAALAQDLASNLKIQKPDDNSPMLVEADQMGL